MLLRKPRDEFKVPVLFYEEKLNSLSEVFYQY